MSAPLQTVTVIGTPTPLPFQQLLNQSVSPRPVASPIVRAQTDFERLLQKEFKPRGRVVDPYTPTQRAIVEKGKRNVGKYLSRFASRLTGPLSALLTAAELSKSILQWNAENFKPRKKANSVTFKSGAKSYERSAIRESGLLEVVVRATKGQSNRATNPRAGILPLAVRSAQQSRRVATDTSNNGAVSAGGPKRGTRRAADSDGALTRTQDSALFSPRTRTQPALRPIDPQRDTCERYRKPRPKCPARGYKLKAVAWRKVPCQ